MTNIICVSFFLFVLNAQKGAETAFFFNQWKKNPDFFTLKLFPFLKGLSEFSRFGMGEICWRFSTNGGLCFTNIETHSYRSHQLECKTCAKLLRRAQAIFPNGLGIKLLRGFEGWSFEWCFFFNNFSF